MLVTEKSIRLFTFQYRHYLPIPIVKAANHHNIHNRNKYHHESYHRNHLRCNLFQCQRIRRYWNKQRPQLIFVTRYQQPSRCNSSQYWLRRWELSCCLCWNQGRTNNNYAAKNISTIVIIMPRATTDRCFALPEAWSMTPSYACYSFPRRIRRIVINYPYQTAFEAPLRFCKIKIQCELYLVFWDCR